jgi:TerC family integral membrane protein
MSIDLVLWGAFAVLVLGALAVDLGVFQRKAHVVHPKEALAWSAVWIGLALVFDTGVYFLKGPVAAEEFLAGYLIEKSLSVDNIFVFLVIFSSFGVPRQHESRILVWGILGALVFRALFVAAGAALLASFSWMFTVFGVFLILTGLKMLLKREEVHPDRSWVVRLLKRMLGVTGTLHGQRFFVREDGRLRATPLFLTLAVVEVTDILFAVDSIPAIFAVTTDPFIVYTSNVFAILGLRTLYFLVAESLSRFRFLKYGLVLILWFVGTKMLISHSVKVPILLSLAVIGGLLAGSIVLSLALGVRRPQGEDERRRACPP